MYIIQKQLHEHHEISRLFPNVSIAGIHYFRCARRRCIRSYTRQYNDNTQAKQWKRERKYPRIKAIANGREKKNTHTFIDRTYAQIYSFSIANCKAKMLRKQVFHRNEPFICVHKRFTFARRFLVYCIKSVIKPQNK